MGETAHLKLKTISETDDMPVKDFFQNLAGDVSSSNMQKIDEAVHSAKQTADAAIPASAKGKENGVATLGSDKKIIKEQIPPLDYFPSDTNLDAIKDGETRKAVTQEEKNYWNAKSDFDGSYNNLKDKPTQDDIPDGVNYKRVTSAEKSAWNAKSNFSGSYADLSDVPSSFTPSSHTHHAMDVDFGTFGGKIKAQKGGNSQPSFEPVLRNCSFAESTSSVEPQEGEIVFYYEV